ARLSRRPADHRLRRILRAVLGLGALHSAPRYAGDLSPAAGAIGARPRALCPLRPRSARLRNQHPDRARHRHVQIGSLHPDGGRTWPAVVARRHLPPAAVAPARPSVRDPGAQPVARVRPAYQLLRPGRSLRRSPAGMMDKNNAVTAELFRRSWCVRGLVDTWGVGPLRRTLPQVRNGGNARPRLGLAAASAPTIGRVPTRWAL